MNDEQERSRANAAAALVGIVELVKPKDGGIVSDTRRREAMN
jgi:hypothetical protein